MLVMDASASSTKSRHASAADVRHTTVVPVVVPVSKPPKALAPQVLSSLPANEAPEKPVFVKRDERLKRQREEGGVGGNVGGRLASRLLLSRESSCF